MIGNIVTLSANAIIFISSLRSRRLSNTGRAVLASLCTRTSSTHLSRSSTPQALYTPYSKRVALGIGNWALGSYCLAVTQAKHFIVFVCPNSSFPMPKFANAQSNLFLIRCNQASNKSIIYNWANLVCKE